MDEDRSMSWATKLFQFRQRDVGGRIELVSGVVEAWYGPPARDQSADTSRALPPALRLFHEKLGASLGTVCRQNRLLPARELRESAGMLVIGVENQGVYTWATRLASEDAPVFGRFQGEPWTQEESALSEFLLGFVLLEAIFAAPHGAAAASLDPFDIDRLTRQMTPLELPPWRWPAHPGRFFIRGEALAFCCPNSEEATSCWVGARQAHDVAFMKPLAGPQWEHLALG
ncbi:MAG TPA: hypothetical protein VIE36_23330 [Methylomirabilota bacterium]